MSAPGPPQVAVLFNEGSAESDCGKNLALYLGGCIASAGVVSNVVFFPAGRRTREEAEAAVGLPLVLLSQRSRQPVEVPADRYACAGEADLGELRRSGIVIVCWQVGFAVPDRWTRAVPRDAVVFSFQAGLNGHKALNERLENVPRVLHGVACFDVLRVDSGALVHVGDTQLVVERLSKEKASALNYVSMFEKIGFPVWSRGLMKAVWHGRSMAMASHALNALTAGSLSDTLRDWRLRRVHAAIVREGDRALSKVAAGKKWRPDTTGTALLDPAYLAMALSLPSPLWRLAGGQVLTGSDMAAPMRADLAAGKRTVARQTLGELEGIARAVKVATPVTTAVLRLVEEAARRGEAPAMTSAELYEAVGRPGGARRELLVMAMRVVGVVGVVVVLAMAL